MKSAFKTLGTLQSLDASAIEQLKQLGIRNLGDLLAYEPFRLARCLRAARDNILRREEVIDYVDDSARDLPLAEILDGPAEALRDLGRQSGNILKRLGIRTIADLASYIPFEEAEEIVSRAPSDDRDPFAPPCVHPTCKKFSRNSKSYTSFFKERELRGVSISSTGDSAISNLFKFGTAENKVIHLGYSVSYLQEWVYCGVHLGEPQGSINLSMAQDTQVSMVDWRRAMKALRREDTRVAERLASVLIHQRAVDEVARATAEEHQHGATSSFGANAATAGSFTAAGAVVGGVGGGISGSLVGLALGAPAGGVGAVPGSLAGAAVGTLVGSVAGAAAGSIIASGATALGFVDTDAKGDRTIHASSGQDIQQRTVQNSSSIRSFWSNIVSQSIQDEQQQIRTDRLTNHNRIHALNALVFEVLNAYRVNIQAQGFAPLIFVPFKPFTFERHFVARYWWLLRTLLKDPKVVKQLDGVFLTLHAGTSTADQLAALPEIDAITTQRITVSVNLDGSAMRSLLGALAETIALGPAVALFHSLFDASKRDKIKVTIVTTDGPVAMARSSSPNSDPNFVGVYETTRAVTISKITGIRVENTNDEFSIFGFDLNQLAFDGISVKAQVRNKSTFTDALPNLRTLEDEETVGAAGTIISAHSSTTLPWDIGDRLRDQFESVDAQRQDLESLQDAALDAAQAEKNLIHLLNANRFTFTRLILQGTEQEQVIKALEGVEIGGVALSSFASTTPIGFCANHVVLPLKRPPAADGAGGPITIDTSKLEVLLAQYDDLDRKQPDAVVEYARGLLEFLRQFTKTSPAGAGLSARDRTLLDMATSLKELLERSLATLAPGAGRGTIAATPAGSGVALLDLRLGLAIGALLAFLRTTVVATRDDLALLLGYFDSVTATLAPRIGELLRTDEVSLPSPAVFMEPVLSNAKGAELYDMRRNSHYEVLEAPAIGAADPNVLRSESVQLTPTVPAPTLTIQNAPELPLPNSLTAALGEVGKLNLGTLISTNASSLTSMLANLSSVASELAKASAQLTGSAQQQVLASATDVAKQVGAIVSKSLASDSPPPTPSPSTQQEKAEVQREAERIDKGKGTPQQKEEGKKTIGAAVVPDKKHAYQMAIRFLDVDGIPYTEGAFDFTLTMRLFELGTVVDVNGGQAIAIERGGFFFPERIPLTAGNKFGLDLVATVDGTTVPGGIDITLPDQADVAFECTMKSETRDIQATDAKTAVDQAVATSDFGAGLSLMLDAVVNAGAKFPFKLAEVHADGTVEQKPSFSVEYKRGGTTTTGSTTTTTTQTTFRVTIPKNGWTIVSK